MLDYSIDESTASAMESFINEADKAKASCGADSDVMLVEVMSEVSVRANLVKALEILRAIV